MENKLNIGMAFSGGGYRAATFDLGTLSFLNSIRLDDGRTLLDCVSVLSSVSGGTIPAMRYMLARARGEDVDQMIEELFDFLCNGDLVGLAMEGLSAEKANRNVSSIKMMANIYDQHLFGNSTMADIIDNFDRIPVKDYTALATDFDSSLPFRFRLTEGRMTDGARMTYGVFGNNPHSIGRSIVRHITPGEALACSSCFPSGFEPMVYPNDFKVFQQPELASQIKGHFSIMDGGVVDNQGIDPILLAEERMKKYREDKTRTDKALDLVIISDVSTNHMDYYEPSEQIMPDSIGKLTLGRLRNYGLICEVVTTVLFILALVMGNNFWLGVVSVILAIVTLLNISGALLKNKMFSAIGKTFIGDKAAFISHLKFATAEAMLMNRAKSLIIMTSEVFLKRLRQINYSSIYNDETWCNRLVSSTIYELSTQTKWESEHIMDTINELVPSEAIQQNSDQAMNMGTTLWFTDKDKAKGLPQAVIAAGQYNICYNLLDYINKIEIDPTNTTEAHKLLIDCRPQLQEAWKKFQSNPQWMVPKRKD